MRAFPIHQIDEEYRIEEMEKWLREELCFGTLNRVIVMNYIHHVAIPTECFIDGNLAGAYGLVLEIRVVDQPLRGMYCIERELLDAMLADEAGFNYFHTESSFLGEPEPVKSFDYAANVNILDWVFTVKADGSLMVETAFFPTSEGERNVLAHFSQYHRELLAALLAPESEMIDLPLDGREGLTNVGVVG